MSDQVEEGGQEDAHLVQVSKIERLIDGRYEGGKLTAMLLKGGKNRTKEILCRTPFLLGIEEGANKCKPLPTLIDSTPLRVNLRQIFL